MSVVPLPSRGERLAVIAAAVACAVALTASAALWRWDRTVYDLLLPQVVDTGPPREPVVVAIDERSLSELGRWPWPRSLHARLLDRLTEAGARGVGLDLLFAEPDGDPGGDRLLAAAIARNARVVLPLAAESPRLGGPLRETLPLPELAAAAAALGHVDLEVDGDGMVRTTFLAAGMGAPRWRHFALALASIAGAGPAVPLASAADAGRDAPANGAPADGASPYRWVREQAVMIPFLGPPGRFARLSYADVLAGRVPPSLLHDRVVLVGATAAGLGDALPTPASARALPMPGVEVLASVYRGWVDGRLLRPAGALAGALLAGLLTLLPLALLANARWGAYAAAAAAAAALPLLVCAALLGTAGLWWPPLGAVAGTVTGFLIWGWRRAGAARSDLARSRLQAAATLRAIGDAVVTTDGRGRVTFMNPVAQTLLGRGDARGVPVSEAVRLIDGNAPEPARAMVMRAMRTGESFCLDNWLELDCGNRGRRSVDVTVSPVTDESGCPRGAVLAIRDVTASRQLERQVQHQASHDPLTDLPNRTLLRDRLHTGLARARRGQHRVAVIALNVDRFKSVNESFGHAFGDRLLQAVAKRLREAGRAQDTVARVGGDEFVVVIEDVQGTVDVAVTARRIREAVARPLKVGEQDLFVTASVGVSIFPRDARDVEGLLRNADSAMHRAKESGRNTTSFFCQDVNRMVRRRIDLERALRRALDRGGDGLEMHYQPIVSLRTGKVTGAEALLRWSCEELGTVDPAEFVSVAEECGLIVRLGEWALFAACRQARAWEQAGLAAMRISVNLSPRQLAGADVPALVRAALAENQLDASLLELEITESVMLNDVSENIDALNSLRALGVRVAVDDFGTGYSSLSFLKLFPVDRVKIDRSFVQDIGSNRESTAIVKAVMAMARSLGLSVVAEGLETRSQVDFLRERDCDEGQGYFLCRPGAADDIAGRLREQHDLRAGARH